MSRNTSSEQPSKAKLREDRQKAALKANLARRKAQTRARKGKEDNEKAG